MVKISASVLSADFARLGEEVKALIEAGTDYIHADIMDGSFVPNLTFGPCIVNNLKKQLPNIIIDSHLMVHNAEKLFPLFAPSSDIITVHVEDNTHLDALLRNIKKTNRKVGVALNPATPINVIENIMDVIDLILIMSVNPGFGGQEFLNNAFDKIVATKKLIDVTDKNIMLSVDGGINKNNARDIVAAGADILVIGSALFQGGAKQYQKNIQQIRNAI